jgi:hypothetical protein
MLNAAYTGCFKIIIPNTKNGLRKWQQLWAEELDKQSYKL